MTDTAPFGLLMAIYGGAPNKPWFSRPQGDKGLQAGAGSRVVAVSRRHAIANNAALSEGVEKLAGFHAQQAKMLPSGR